MQKYAKTPRLLAGPPQAYLKQVLNQFPALQNATGISHAAGKNRRVLTKTIVAK
jgi:hypothetical protein